MSDYLTCVPLAALGFIGLSGLQQWLNRINVYPHKPDVQTPLMPSHLTLL